MTTAKLTPEQIKPMIEDAFLPHKAFAEIFDYHFRMRFQVRHEKDNSILCTMPDLLVHNINTPQTLHEVLDAAREHVRNRLAPVPPAIPKPPREYDPHGEV